jgi:hypothetical protein
VSFTTAFAFDMPRPTHVARGAVERMMHELGGGGFSVRPLSQFPAPVTGTTTGPAVSDDSEADPRGSCLLFR